MAVCAHTNASLFVLLAGFIEYKGGKCSIKVCEIKSNRVSVLCPECGLSRTYRNKYPLWLQKAIKEMREDYYSKWPAIVTDEEYGNLGEIKEMSQSDEVQCGSVGDLSTDSETRVKVEPLSIEEHGLVMDEHIAQIYVMLIALAERCDMLEAKLAKVGYVEESAYGLPIR